MLMTRLLSFLCLCKSIIEFNVSFPSPTGNTNLFLLFILMTLSFGSCDNQPLQPVVNKNTENVIVQDIGKAHGGTTVSSGDCDGIAAWRKSCKVLRGGHV